MHQFDLTLMKIFAPLCRAIHRVFRSRRYAIKILLLVSPVIFSGYFLLAFNKTVTNGFIAGIMIALTFGISFLYLKACEVVFDWLDSENFEVLPLPVARSLTFIVKWRTTDALFLPPLLFLSLFLPETYWLFTGMLMRCIALYLVTSPQPKRGKRIQTFLAKLKEIKILHPLPQPIPVRA